MTDRYTPHDLAVLIPVLGRPHHLPPLLASLDATVPGARVVLLVTPGDSAEPAAWQSGRDVLPVPWLPAGDFQRKINAGYRHTSEALLFVGATDLQFEAGWFEAAVACFLPGVGVVGTNDMCNPRVMRGDHATHFLVTREYADQRGTIDEPGKILHEGYVHEFCDAEAVETAKHRLAWMHAADSVVRHRHPMCDPTIPPGDPVYEAQRERMRESWPLFRQRRRLWEPAPVRRLRHPARRR